MLFLLNMMLVSYISIISIPNFPLFHVIFFTFLPQIQEDEKSQKRSLEEKNWELGTSSLFKIVQFNVKYSKFKI